MPLALCTPFYWVSVGGGDQQGFWILVVGSCFKEKYKKVFWQIVVNPEIFHEVAWSGRSGKELSLMSPARDTTLEAGSA
jgi:hypothetical protein